MAGTFIRLEFSDSAATCNQLAERLSAFADQRMSLRQVRRLEATEPVFGQRPQEWREAGVSPADLSLEDHDWHREVVDTDVAASIEEALERWPIGPWVGLCVDYVLPPGADGFPTIYGACWWRLWAGRDGRWRHSASIEYPMSNVARDPRWSDWLAVFRADAERAFGSP